jgi:16S rRNA (guanine1207-N2)-methyltransferase
VESSVVDHYYSQSPEIESQPQFVKINVCGVTIDLKTDRGVFSKNALDFGTRTLLEAFQLPKGVEGGILDVGCGYGPIGITLKLLHPDRQVTMIDVNERAVQLAKENVLRNSVKANIFQSHLFEQVEGLFSVILSNPPIRAGKAVVHEILEKSHDHLHEGGELWVVIQKKQGAPSALTKLKEVYREVETVRKDKGYYVFCAKR